jgi:hypothetical protein
MVEKATEDMHETRAENGEEEESSRKRQQGGRKGRGLSHLCDLRHLCESKA